MIRARFLGFERETVKDNWVLPAAQFSIKIPVMRRSAFCNEPCCATEGGMHPIDIAYAEYELERVLSIDDGGPLAIYGRVK